jgi:uncharacterized protein (TIGR02996 family)
MIDPDADALLRAIVRHPDDDTPRLVYADWLQENGRAEEAEILRVQCGLAGTEPGAPEYPELFDRDAELRLWLGTHVPGPRPTFPSGLSVEGGNRWWEHTSRGFPRFLEFEGYQKYGVKAMRKLAESLEHAFETLPTRWLAVREVTVSQLATLLKQPVLAKVSELTVQLTINGDEANEVARLVSSSRHLRNLRGLCLRVPCGEPGFAALAGAQWTQLEWFAPISQELTPAALGSLSGAGWVRGLRELILDDDLPAETFELLARLPTFPNLHTLDLSKNAFLTPTGWDSFAKARNFPALARLRANGTDLSGERLLALAGASGFALAVLNLCECGTGPGTGAALAAAPWAGELRILDLGYNGLEPDDVKALAECKKFGALRHLGLLNNALAPTGLAALSANPALRGLRALNLAGRSGDCHGLTPTHFDRFLARLDAPDLRHLDLSGRPVGPKAARRLTDPKFAGLTRLGLRGCKLTDPAVSALIAAPTLRNLIQLDLTDNRLTTGPEPLANRAILPQLASCSLTANAIPAPVVRKLRRRPGVRA